MGHLVRFSTYSSFFIAMAATALSFYYSQITKSPLDFYRLVVVFFGTWVSYLGVQFIPLNKNQYTSKRSLWLKENKIVIISIMLACSFAIVASVKSLKQLDLLNFAHLFIIMLFYEKIFSDEKELRKIPFLKSFLIAYVWACVCVAPQLLEKIHHFQFTIWLEVYFYILALTIPFDIRDVEIDHNQGVRTLATSFKISRVKQLSFIFLLISFCLQFQYLKMNFATIIISVMIAIVYLLLLARTWPNQKDHIFLLGFDGLIFVKLLYLAAL
jgi:4-hydroxybenzoate polyprenyltransferase